MSLVNHILLCMFYIVALTVLNYVKRLCIEKSC